MNPITKIVIFISCLFSLVSIQLSGQDNYVLLSDASGFDRGEYQNEMEQEVALFNGFIAEQNDLFVDIDLSEFKVYDSGTYLHNENMDLVDNTLIEVALNQIDQTKNYILFHKVTTAQGVYERIILRIGFKDLESSSCWDVDFMNSLLETKLNEEYKADVANIANSKQNILREIAGEIQSTVCCSAQNDFQSENPSEKKSKLFNNCVANDVIEQNVISKEKSQFQNPNAKNYVSPTGAVITLGDGQITGRKFFNDGTLGVFHYDDNTYVSTVYRTDNTRWSGYRIKTIDVESYPKKVSYSDALLFERNWAVNEQAIVKAGSFRECNLIIPYHEYTVPVSDIDRDGGVDLVVDENIEFDFTIKREFFQRPDGWPDNGSWDGLIEYYGIYQLDFDEVKISINAPCPDGINVPSRADVFLGTLVKGLYDDSFWVKTHDNEWVYFYYDFEVDEYFYYLYHPGNIGEDAYIAFIPFSPNLSDFKNIMLALAAYVDAVSVEAIHFSLDLIGSIEVFYPVAVLADLVNGTIYLVEGEEKEAHLSFGAAAFSGVILTKYGKKIIEFGKDKIFRKNPNSSSFVETDNPVPEVVRDHFRKNPFDNGDVAKRLKNLLADNNSIVLAKIIENKYFIDAFRHLEQGGIVLKTDLSNIDVFGKLADDLLSGGEVLVRHFNITPNAVKAWKGLFNTGVRTEIPWLTRASKWIDEGGDFVESGGKTWFRKNGDDIFEIKIDKILPNKKSNYHQGADGTPIGDPANGYQVVKVGDDIKVKRVPDESPYVNTPYQTKLTEHPNSHVLERHGHDVTDDALIKRANEGIAPDGSTISPNPPYTKPPYSSKFDSPDALKNGYDNTKPGTTAFNNTPVVNGKKVVYHTLPSGSYGKGVPKNGSTFETSTKVRAVYQDMGNGNFQLLAMFPDF